MTLAIMTRATLGHTGRPLAAGPMTEAIYVFILVAGICRIAAAIHPDFDVILLHLAALFWLLAFGLFVGSFGPMLLKPRRHASA